ncbi:MAG: ABC transporter permease [Lachnospiraceae bacterium]|nr:ABC transporter permease [Lachnospiraceae bacterium]
MNFFKKIFKKKVKSQEDYYLASQWTLMGRKLKKHKLARVSMLILGILYFGALFGNFLAPYGLEEFDSLYRNSGSTKIRFVHEGEFVGPFVYKLEKTIDRTNFSVNITENTSEYYPIEFFVHGTEYKFLGLFKTDLHLFGAGTGSNGGTGAKVMLFGADSLGRDLFSRVLYGSQVSLTIPFASAIISFFLGILIGSLSGYFGGTFDIIVQRIIEVIGAVPQIPLWMALSTAIPAGISTIKMYFYMTLILSFINWTGMARVVRGKMLSLKNEDYVMAARLSGVSTWNIIWKHLVPGFMSYLIVSMTLGIPGSIVGETSMSYLGLGIKSPATSWGVLLQEASAVTEIASHPHKLIPIIFVTVAVLAFNFLGDGLRDAADPYK